MIAPATIGCYAFYATGVVVPCAIHRDARVYPVRFSATWTMMPTGHYKTFYMLYAYGKNQQGDLSAAQLRTWSRFVREELK